MLDAACRADGRLALIIGAAGQDGTLLSQHLNRSGYTVLPVVRRGIVSADGSIDPLDLLDVATVDRLIGAVTPDEIYYIAAHHHSSEEDGGSTPHLLRQSYDTHCQSFANILDACARKSCKTRIFYASSALVYGNPEQAPQSETTTMRPVCVYGITKQFGMGLCEVYRRDHGLFCSAGILFNHESHLRPERFVTRKIAKAVAEIKSGARKSLTLAAPGVQVDWSAAEDFVRAMHASLAIDEPLDFVYASGQLHSIQDFCEVAFRSVGLNFQDYVEVDSSLMKRSARSVPLHGDPSRLVAATGWRPRISFEEMVSGMVQSDMDRVS